MQVFTMSGRTKVDFYDIAIKYLVLLSRVLLLNVGITLSNPGLNDILQRIKLQNGETF